MQRSRWLMGALVLAIIVSMAGCTMPVLVTPTPAAAPVEGATMTPAVLPTVSEAPTSEATAAPTTELTPTAEVATGEITLVPFVVEAKEIEGLAPEGWEEAVPGVFARRSSATDPTAITFDSVAVDPPTLEPLLATQLGLDELPESTGTREASGMTWTLYSLETQGVSVDVALAPGGAGTLAVLLQCMPDEREALYEQVFLPAVDALQVVGAEQEGAAGGAGQDMIEDPTGRFSVPIPTNWTAEAAEGYLILTSPQGGITAYFLAVEGDDIREAVAQAWETVDPTFDLEPEEVIEGPASGIKADADTAFTVTYDTGDDEQLILGGGWTYEGVIYIELFEADLASFQRRVSQVQIMDSGLRIHAMEVADLSGVEPLPLSDELLGELEAYATTLMDQLSVPGAEIAIVRDGEIVYAEGFGVRQLGEDEPVTPETLMMIGSSTKSMTTMLMAQLVDEGVMTWDTPVVDILPTFTVADPEITEQITMRNMVCACTGVPRRDFELIFNADELSAEDIVASLADFEFFTDFGEAFQYSNQMVATAGYVGALAAGGEYGSLYDDYVVLMQERIFDPIGMESSTFSFDEVTASGNYAIPHQQAPTGEMVVMPVDWETMLVPVAPAGSLWSNAIDMGRYLITQLNQGVAPDGTRIVSAENLSVTWEPQIQITADASYGLGWMVTEYKGLPVLTHGGNTFGFTSDLTFLPDAGIGISVLTNQRGSYFNQAVSSRLLELLYEQEPETDEMIQFAIEQTEEAIAENAEQIQDAVDPEAIEPYLGRYGSDVLGEMTLSLVNGTLVMDVGEFEAEVRSRINDEGEIDYFIFDSPMQGLGLELEEDEAGQPQIVMGAGVVEYTFEKIE